jgi:hypothetical protein
MLQSSLKIRWKKPISQVSTFFKEQNVTPDLALVQPDRQA